MYKTYEKLNGLGATIGNCLSAMDFANYRRELSAKGISVQSSEIDVPNLGKRKGWLFGNGEFWVIDVTKSAGKPTYCYLHDTNLNNKTPIQDKARPVPTELPSIGRPTPMPVPVVASGKTQFNNCRIECDEPKTISGLAEDVNNCFEKWEFDAFGATPENGNFVDSDGKLYTSAMRSEWDGTVQYYVLTTINGVPYYCPANSQPQNSIGANNTFAVNTTEIPKTGGTVPYATTNPIVKADVIATGNEECPVDCEEIEEEITLYLSEVPADVYEEITIQETKEVCETPPDSVEIESDCDDIINALKQKYPNIELGSLMGLAGLMGCGSKRRFTVQGLGSAGSDTGTTTNNIYTVIDSQIAELKQALAQKCPTKNIEAMNDSDIATAIGQSIPIAIITDIAKVTTYLKENMDVIAENICKSAKPKTNTAMNAEMIGGIPNWALYLAGAGLLGYGVYKYSNKPKSRKSK